MEVAWLWILDGLCYFISSFRFDFAFLLPIRRYRELALFSLSLVRLYVQLTLLDRLYTIFS